MVQYKQSVSQTLPPPFSQEINVHFKINFGYMGYSILFDRPLSSYPISFDKCVNDFGITVLKELLENKIVGVGPLSTLILIEEEGKN